MTAAHRTAEQVTREIELEREQLALAVSHLRRGLREATNVRAIVRARLPQLAGAAAVAAGAITALCVLRHRRRRG